MKFAKQILLTLALVGAMAFAGNASAQSNWSDNLNGSHAVGDMVGVYNVSADTVIAEGDLVESDTTTVTNGPGRFRLGVKKLGLTASSRLRCIGIAVSRIGTKSVGKVLIRGYHPGAFVGISNASGYAPIKISTTVPGSFAIGDTTAANCGYIVGRTSASTSSGVRYKYRVWFWGAPRTAGPAL